jgi:hypothetical protein
MDAADQLDDKIAVINDLDRVGGQPGVIDSGAILPQVANQNAGDAQVNALARSYAFPTAIDELHQSSSYGATAE